MSVLKLSKNDIIRKKEQEDKIKLKRSDLSFDSARVSGWEQTNRQSIDIINDYNSRINKSEWLDKEDRAKYRSAIDSYIETANLLRGINKTFGEGYSDEDEQKWTDSIASMNQVFADVENLYSLYESADEYKSWKDEYDFQKAINDKAQGILSAEDFAENSQYKSTYRGGEKFNAWSGMYTDTGYDDLTYDYINKDETAIGRMNLSSVMTNAGLLGIDRSELQHMEDQEISVFNYIYATEGPDAAYEYIKGITAELNARQREAYEAYYAKYANDSPVLSSIFSVITSPLKGLSYLGQAADYFNDGKIDQNAGYNKFSYTNSAIRDTVSKNIEQNWGGVGSFAYQTGMSMADFLFSSAISGGSSVVATTIMGTGAAADTVVSARDRGLNSNQAFALGTIAGVTEAVTEKYSFAALFDAAKLGENALGYVLSNALTEGSEEVTSSLINLVADVLISKNKSEWQTAINAYMASGMSESDAIWRAVADQALSLGVDFLGGFISGGVLGGAGAIANTAVKSANAKKTYGNNIQDLLIESAEIGGSNAALVDKLVDKYGKKGTLSGSDLYRLVDANDAAIKSGDKTAIANYLTKLGEGGNVGRVADVVLKKAMGEELTAKEETILEKSKYGNEVADKIDANEIGTGNLASELSALEVPTDSVKQTAVPKSEATPDLNEATEYKALKSDVDLVKQIATERVGNIEGWTEEVSSAMIKGYDERVSPTEYATAFQDAFNMGANNVPASKLVGVINSGVSERVAYTAYALGKQKNVGTVLKSVPRNGIINTNTSEANNERRESIHLRDGGKRDGSKDTQRQISRVEGGTGEAEIRGENRNVADSEAARLVNEGREVKVSDLGILGGSSEQTVRVPDKASETTSMKEAREKAEARGLKVTFFVGDNLLIKDKNGKWISARAYIKGKHIFVRADHPIYTSDQLMRHELGHDMIAKGEVDIEAVRERLEEIVGKENVDAVAKHYAAAYEGSGLTAEEIWEECICDSLGDMNVFAGKSEGVFLDLMLPEIKAAASESKAPTQTRGSPDGKASGELRNLNSQKLDKVSPEEAKASGEVSDAKFSIEFADDIANKQRKYEADGLSMISSAELEKAISDTARMVEEMKPYANILPQDKVGKTLVKNGSYDVSVENTTVCIRTLAYNSFVDMVSEKVGRPLTQMESFLVSQKLYEIAKEPQCLYCYVSLDRKAFNEMVIRYTEQRDAAIKAYEEAGKPKVPASFNAEWGLFNEFLDGRKPTKNMWDRYVGWLNAYNKGERLVSLADISTEAKRLELVEAGGEMASQVKDMLKYAQSASWAKKQTQYVAYYDEILKLKPAVIRNLNSHYGMRWYSFSDYSGAFIVENMQQITDAAIRGLKGLSYTKDTDFAEIFAPTGMNINISVYAKKGENGYEIDAKQSANIDEAIKLRNQYPNVGIVVVATDAKGVEWALEQEWSDVVIPFHTVRTGADVAEFYNWEIFNAEQSDTVADQNLWDAYVNSVGKKKASKMVYPSEHQNNKDTYLRIINERGLKPRFSSFLDNPNYMKLVNETRQSEGQTQPLKPNYNLDAALRSFDKFVEKGGYYEGWYNDGIDVDNEADIVASDVRAGKKANEVDYGRQDISFDDVAKSRKTNRQHGKASMELDTEYLSAVNRGDMETAQRMVDEAAKEAGYAYKGYHGTKRGGFTVFKNRMPGVIEGIKSIFLAKDEGTAAQYAYGANKKIYSLYAKMESPLIVNCGYSAADNISTGNKPEIRELANKYLRDAWERANPNDNLTTDQIGYLALRSGIYDGVIFKNVNDSYTYRNITDVYEVFEPEQVKSADPVTYDDDGNVIPLSERFNPEQSDIRFSRELDFIDYINENEVDDDLAMEYSKADKSMIDRLHLINALESITDYPSERVILSDYRAMVETIAESEKRIASIDADIKVLSKNAKANAEAIKTLKAEQKTLEMRVHKADEKVLKLESTKALKGVVESERAKAYQKAKQKGREALLAQRSRSDAKLDAVKDYYRGKLAEKRVKAAAKLDATVRRYQEARARNVEGRHKTEIRHKIQKVARELDLLLNKGTKQRNVKNGEAEIVRRALDLSEMLFATDDELVVRGLDVDLSDAEAEALAEYKKLYEEYHSYDDAVTENKARRAELRSIMNEIKRGLADALERERKRISKAKASASFDALINAYKTLADAKEDYLKLANKPEVVEYIEALKANVGETLVSEMTLGQLESVYKAFKMIKEMVTNSNKIWRDGKRESMEERRSAIFRQIGGLKNRFSKDYPEFIGKALGEINEFGWNNLRPVDAFELIGSDSLTELFWDVIDAQSVYARDIEEVKNAIVKARQKYGYKGWDINKTKSFKMPDGRTFTVTLGEMMSIYAYSKRDRADAHMREGGFQHAKGATYKDGKVVKLRSNKHLTYKVDDKLRFEIINSLTAEQKAYAAEIQALLTAWGEKGNEASRILYGIDLFNEEVYFPLKSSRDYLDSVQTEIGQTATTASLAGSGMAKPTKPHANNPIILQAFDDVVLEHFDRMSKYHAYVVPIENLRKMLDAQSIDDSENMLSIKALIGEKLGDGAREYLQNYITDLNGSATVSGAKNPLESFFGKSKAAAVAANLSVWVQQYFSVIRAFSEVNPRYFIPFMGEQHTKGDMKAYEEMKKYAPIATIKEMGGFDVGSNRGIKDYVGYEETGKVKGKVSKKMQDIYGFGANLMDRLGWITIWKGIKKEVAASGKYKVGSEEYFNACGKRFEEVIVKTQVYDSVNARSGYMRSKSGTVKYLVSFMGEPTTIVGMAEVAVIKLERAIASKDKVAIRKATAALTATMASIAISTAMTSIAKSLVYAMRDDDEDETYFEKYMEALIGAFKDDVNLLNYFPVARDIVSIFEGRTIERPDMTLLADAIDSLLDFWDSVDDGDSGEEIASDAFALAGSIANIFGHPMKNIWRDLKALYNTIINTNN